MTHGKLAAAAIRKGAYRAFEGLMEEYTGGTVPYGYLLGFAAHSLSAYSSSVRSVKVSGRANIASFRKAG